jgi:hypothetical protein
VGLDADVAGRRWIVGFGKGSMLAAVAGGMAYDGCWLEKLESDE